MWRMMRQDYLSLPYLQFQVLVRDDVVRHYVGAQIEIWSNLLILKFQAQKPGTYNTGFKR